MENICDLLVLGDEYDVANVKKECRRFLTSATLDDQMAMKILLLAQKHGFDDLRTKCYKHLASIKLDKLKNLDGFQDLDANSMKSILLPQVEESQSCLSEVLPQLIGLMEFTVYLLTFANNDNLTIQSCSEHYQIQDGREAFQATRASDWRLRHCIVCQEMFKRIHKFGKENILTGYHPHSEYKYGDRSLHFDEKIVDVSCKVMDILGIP